ncbi:MAG TPA: chorismate-binding protein [Vicinamibacteria bacterium]|nr:chorismate-binding protein [Vicinamibacteria bacterium]
MVRISAKSRVSALPAARARGPLEFFREVRGDGGALMESAAFGSPGGTRSLVVPEGAIRLELRGAEATYRGLSPMAEFLLDALGDGHAREGGVLRMTFPTGPGSPASPDEERLREPSVLDSVRLLAGLVEDDPPGLAIPAGIYGAFSYELVDCWEDLPQRPPDPWHEPDVNVVLALDTVLFDHTSDEVRIVTRATHPSERAAADARHRRYEKALLKRGRSYSSNRRITTTKGAEADVSDETFLASVEKFLRHIASGDIFQGVLSRGLIMRSRAEPLDVYRALRESNPSPYMFHVDLGDGVLLGASPETCLKLTGRSLEIRPIAGTAPRGFDDEGTIDEELDTRLAIGLLLDRKEQAEHAMLVDLARNDVARVSVPGTRRVDGPFTIEKYSHVQHLVSGVQGQLRPDLDALHAYRAAANMGTLTGAPKLRAMELIRETEPFARGFYGGAVGYLLQDGTFDSCIVIRSLRYGRGRYYTRTGAGVVADSLPERELRETEHKARAVRHAVAAAEGAV